MAGSTGTTAGTASLGWGREADAFSEYGYGWTQVGMVGHALYCTHETASGSVPAEWPGGWESAKY